MLLNTELIGIAILTEDVENFDAAWIENKIIPKIFYKIYLKEELRDIVDGVLGIELSVLTN